MLGNLASLLSALTWALGSTAYARASHRHTAFSINLTRAFAAAPLFLLCALLFGDWSSFSGLWSSTALWLSLSVFSSYGVGDLVFLAAAKRIGVPGALAVGSIFPVWNSLLGTYLKKEVLSGHQVIGLILTLFFLVIVILSSADRPRNSKRTRSERDRTVIGVCLAVLTSVFWATNSFCIAQAGGRLDPWVTNTFRMGMAIVMAWTFGTLATRRVVRPLPWTEVRSVLPVYVFEAFGGSALYVYGLSHTSMALGATLSSLAPVLAVPIAWVTRSEKVSWLKLLGVCGVVFGVWLLLQP